MNALVVPHSGRFLEFVTSLRNLLVLRVIFAPLVFVSPGFFFLFLAKGPTCLPAPRDVPAFV